MEPSSTGVGSSHNSQAPSLPKINGRHSSMKRGGGNSESLARLGSTFMGTHDRKTSLQFSPPNITAFRRAEVGESGSLFQTQNDRITTQVEAQLVENRVKVLEKEEERMMKKINEARKQAHKMEEMREERNSHYMNMVEFKLKQKFQNEILKQKNAQVKATRNNKYQTQKAELLRKNQEDYHRIRKQRQMCLEEKYNIQDNYTSQKQQLYRNQKSQEINLRHMHERQKQSRMFQNKQRYESMTIDNTVEKDRQQKRLMEAAARETQMMQKFQQTMAEQKGAVSALEEAISKNRLKKNERMDLSGMENLQAFQEKRNAHTSLQ